MKVLVVLALCVALAQAGRIAVKSNRDTAWLVHIRIANADSGLLSTCLGSLIGPQWVLTAANCIQDSRFIWNRFNAEKVINPELVLEAGPATVNLHPEFNSVTGEHNIGYIQFTRFIHSSTTIAPIALETADSELAETGSFCGYGEENSAPGEDRVCYTLTLESEDALVISTSDDSTTTVFDVGGPLTVDDVQVGLLVAAPGPNDSMAGIFLRVGTYYEWLAEATNNFGATDEE